MQNAPTLAVCSTALAAPADVQAGQRFELQLMPVGRVAGRSGAFEARLDDIEHMKRVIAASMARAGRTELVVDYDHQAIHAARTGGRAPAAGWLKSLEARADGIWGTVEWTQAAATAIRAREYRYLSPVFQYAPDGAVLSITMAGLTNTPDLDIAEVAASALSQNHTGTPFMDKILAALGLMAGADDAATEASILTAIASALAVNSAVAVKLGLDETAKPGDVQAAAASAMKAVETLGTVAKSVGLKSDADSAAVATAVASAVKGGAPDPTAYVPIGVVTDLQKQLGDLTATVQGDKAETAVASAMEAGKVSPAQKDWATAYASADPAGFDAYVASATAIVTPGARTAAASSRPPISEAETSEADSVVMAAMGLSADAFADARKQEAR